jgi:protein-disulfide isomerase
MTSGKQAKRRRRAQQAPPPVRSGSRGRQASPNVLAGAAATIALVAVAAGLAFAFIGRSSAPQTTTAATLPDAGVVTRLFRGIPQHGNVLGSPKAPVTMVEYIDLQCPVCRAFETETVPTIIPRYVRNGKVKIVARTIAFIGPDSERGRRAAIAGAQQNRLFNFAQLLYFNQGTENTGWLNDSIIRAAANSIPALDAATLMSSRNSAQVISEEKRFDAQANADHVSGTPGIYVGKSGGKLRAVSPGLAPDGATLSAAFDRARLAG